MLKEMQVLFVYVILSFASDITLITHKSNKFPTLTFVTLSLFTILEFTLFSLFFFWVIKNKYLKKILLISSLSFLLFAISYFLRGIGAKSQFDSLSASIESILIICYCIIFFFDQLNTTEVTVIYESPKFWVVTGFLIYMAGGLFLFIYAESFTKEQKNYYWNINAIINILKNIFIAVTFSMKKDIQNQSPMRRPYNI